VRRELDFVEPNESVKIWNQWARWKHHITELIRQVDVSFFDEELSEDLRELIRLVVGMNNDESERENKFGEWKNMLEHTVNFRVLFEFLDWKFGRLYSLMGKDWDRLDRYLWRYLDSIDNLRPIYFN
jgi:hypothetical protein